MMRSLLSARVLTALAAFAVVAFGADFALAQEAAAPAVSLLFRVASLGPLSAALGGQPAQGQPEGKQVS